MTSKGNPTWKHRAYSRRKFLAIAGGAAAWSVTIVPRHVLGGAGELPPSERVNVAGIGAGGMGGGDIATHAKNGANIVALCDVDDQRAAGSFAAFPKAARYKDFRRMLEKEAKHVDAVTVGTPDHVHAVASMAAIRAGKHVYCQKPLTHTLVECRTLTQAARTAGVMTQMGNQGHATEGARLTNEWIQAGVIGEIREVHTWSDRAGLLWKQGIDRPTMTPRSAAPRSRTRPRGSSISRTMETRSVSATSGSCRWPSEKERTPRAGPRAAEDPNGAKLAVSGSDPGPSKRKAIGPGVWHAMAFSSDSRLVATSWATDYVAMPSVKVAVVSDMPVRWSLTHLMPALQAPSR